MTAKEVIEIVKESNLWATLAPKEKQEAVAYAMKITQLTTKEEDVKNAVGEVYLELQA
jgi:hypothetical protein